MRPTLSARDVPICRGSVVASLAAARLIGRPFNRHCTAGHTFCPGVSSAHCRSSDENFCLLRKVGGRCGLYRLFDSRVGFVRRSSNVEGPFSIDNYTAATPSVAGLASTALRERVDRVRTAKSILGASEAE